MSMRRCWSFGATVKTLMKVSAGTPESMVVIADSIDVPTRCAFPRRAPRKEGLSLGAPMNWRQKSVGIWAARGRAISILGAGVLLQPNDDPIHNGLPEPRDGEHAVALVAGGLVRARRHQGRREDVRLLLGGAALELAYRLAGHLGDRPWSG